MRARAAVLIGVGALSVLVGLGVSLVLFADDGPGGGSPNPPVAVATTGTVVSPDELPTVDPAVADATLSYLDGEGAALMIVVDVAERADELSASEACTAAKDELSDGGSPADLAVLAEGVADEVTRSSIEGSRTALVAVLAACQAGETDDVARDRAVTSAGLARQRLAQLEDA